MAVEWIALGAGGAAAIVFGVRKHRPARIGPWMLLAGSILALAAGDVFYAYDEQAVASLFYYGLFVLVAAGMLQLTRGGAILVDRARLIDMLAFACSMLLVIWVSVIGRSGEFGRISAADVIGDVLLIGVAGRLLVAAGRNWSAGLLLAGAVGLLASNIAYPLSPGWVTEFGFIVLYVCWAAAAVHPSMVRLTQPMPVRPSPWKGRWAALLGISVATPPVVLMIEALSGS